MLEMQLLSEEEDLHQAELEQLNVQHAADQAEHSDSGSTLESLKRKDFGNM
jgi:hypothetical protein